MMNFLSDVIYAVIYFLIIAGLWMVFSKEIIYLIIKRYSEIRFRRRKKKKSKIYKHIELLIFTIFGTRKPGYIYTFFVMSWAIYFIFIIILTRQSSLLINVFFPFLLSLIPYVFLRMRLFSIRVEGSHEGQFLVNELNNQYKINYRNMIEAIDKTIPLLSNAPYTKRLLFRLSLRLKEYRTSEELELILNDFVYAIDTEWAKMLANDIYLTIDEGTDVSVAMEDIIKDLKNAKRAFEENRRINFENLAILKFLSPAVYIFMFLFSIKYLDFTLDKYIYYQFNTATGLKYFTTILILTIVNISISTYLKKRKFDI